MRLSGDKRHRPVGDRPRFAGHHAAGALSSESMAILLLFALGVVNFAMHKAVLESGHPMVARTTVWFGLMGGKLGLAVEFIALLGAMLMVDAGMIGWAWAYLVYSLLNAVSAWLILSGKM
jgi:hypothetical protein